MIQAGGPTKEGESRGKLGRKAPRVVASSLGAPGSRPFIPPGQRPARERFDDENRRAPPSCAEQSPTGTFPRLGLELIEGKRRHDAGARARKRRIGDLRAPRRSGESQRTVGPAGLLDRPGIAVDAFELHGSRDLEHPGSAGGAGPAAEVHDPLGSRRACPEGAHDFTDYEEVERSVKKREGGPLAASVERGTEAKTVAPLHIERREGLE